MRSIRALTDNVSYGELCFIKDLLPYMYDVAWSKDKTFVMNIASFARSKRHFTSTASNAIKALAIAEIITYQPKKRIGTTFKIISPTGVLQLRDYFNSGEANV